MKIVVTSTSQNLKQLINIADEHLLEDTKENRLPRRINLVNMSDETVWVEYGKNASTTEGYPLLPTYTQDGLTVPGGQMMCSFRDMKYLNLKSGGDDADVRFLIN